MPTTHRTYQKFAAVAARAVLPALLVYQTPQNAAAQTTVDSQTVVEYEGSRVRINLSGQMRYISEEVAAATCSLNAGFDIDVSKARLADARSRFDTNFATLSHGNPRLGVPTRETASRVKSSLTELLKLWASTSVSTMHILQNRETGRYAEIVAANTTMQEIATQKTTDEFIAEYVNPAEFFAADALTVSLAGRQLKLIREMERISCAILSGDLSFGDEVAFAETEETFSRTLTAMKTGLESAGVIAPPNVAIVSKLDEISAIWTTFLTQRARLTQENLDQEQSWIEVRELSDRLFGASEQLVSLYLLTAPGNEPAFKTAVLSFSADELISWKDDPAFSDVSRASGFLDVRLAQSKGLILSAALLDESGDTIAASSSWKDEVTDLARPSEIEIGDAEFDPETGGYFCRVSIPVDNGPGASLLVVKLDLLRFL